MGGDVTVSADQGRIEGDALTATRVDASANQGRITAGLRRRRPTHVAAEANQGRVDIVLPDDPDVVYATDTEANQGTVTDRHPHRPAAATARSRSEADQGSVTIGYGAG